MYVIHVHSTCNMYKYELLLFPPQQSVVSTAAPMPEQMGGFPLDFLKQVVNFSCTLYVVSFSSLSPSNCPPSLSLTLSLSLPLSLSLSLSLPFSLSLLYPLSMSPL